MDVKRRDHDFHFTFGEDGDDEQVQWRNALYIAKLIVLNAGCSCTAYSYS